MSETEKLSGLGNWPARPSPGGAGGMESKGEEVGVKSLPNQRRQRKPEEVCLPLVFVRWQGAGQAMGGSTGGKGVVEEREQVRVGATGTPEAWTAGLTAKSRPPASGWPVVPDT